MKNFKHRGTFGAETILALGVVAICGYFGIHFFKQSEAGNRDKSPIANVDEAKKTAEQKELELKKKIQGEVDAQLKTAHGASVGTGVAIAAAQTTTASGKLPVKELATAKTLNDTTNNALDQAIGPLDPKSIEEIKLLVANLNSEIKAARLQGEQALNEINKNLQTTVDEKNQLNETLKATQEKDKIIIDGLQEKANKWALERDAIAAKWDNLMFWVWTAAGIYVFALLAPIIGKVFPAFAPIAGVAGAIVAPMVAYGKAKADDLAKDLVSLNNESKKFIEKIDPAQVDKFKEHVSKWWENDTNSTHAVEEIKKSLRL